MAVKTKRRSTKTKTTQSYVCRDLFNGIADRNFPAGTVIKGQEETPVRVSILRGQYSFTYVINRRREGISKNGIPWKKWEMVGMVVASTKAIGKNGQKRLNLYAKYRVNDPGKTVWFNFHNCSSKPDTLSRIIRTDDFKDFNAELEDLYRTNIGEPPFLASEYNTARGYIKNTGYNMEDYGVNLIYPVMRKADSSVATFDLNPMFSSCFRAADAIQLTRNLFGKYYRKDLVRAVSTAVLLNCDSRLVIARSLKSIVPIDWLVMFLNEPRVTVSWDGNEQLWMPRKDDIKDMKAFFKVLTPPQQKRLLLEMTKTNRVQTWHIADTFRSFNVLKRANFDMGPGSITGKGWIEIHDNLSDRVLDLRSPETEIEKVPLAEEIANLEFNGDFRLVLPKTNRDLRKWGNHMNHCIGSYDFEATTGESVFLALMFKGEMVGNAQIKTKTRKVMQVFGKCNKTVDKVVLNEFTEALTKADIVKLENIQSAAGYR